MGKSGCSQFTRGRLRLRGEPDEASEYARLAMRFSEFTSMWRMSKRVYDREKMGVSIYEDVQGICSLPLTARSNDAKRKTG